MAKKVETRSSANLNFEGSLKKLIKKKKKTKGDHNSNYLVCKRCFKEFYFFLSCILYG